MAFRVPIDVIYCFVKDKLSTKYRLVSLKLTKKCRIMSWSMQQEVITIVRVPLWKTSIKLQNARGCKDKVKDYLCVFVLLA